MKGGSREGAGRPSSWASGVKFEETKAVRVPSAIAEKVLDLAHAIDSGQELLPIDKSMTPSVQRFISWLERTGVHEQTLKVWFDKQIVWASTEAKKYDPPTQKESVSPRQRLHAALIASGEGFMSPDGMQVSEDCFHWAHKAFERSKGVQGATENLAKVENKDVWFHITERLPDSALNSLSAKLERKYLDGYSKPEADRKN